MNAAEESLSRSIVAELRHRLRTILNQIVGYGEMAQDELGPDSAEKIVADLKSICVQTRQLLHLTQANLTTEEREVSQEDMGQLRGEMSGTVHQIARTLAEIAKEIPDKFILDVFRMSSATAELLAFAEGQTVDVQDDAPANSEAIAPVADDIDKPKYSVLIVDDDDTNRDLLLRQVQRLGHAVRAVASGPEAIALCKAHAFDMVLIDFMMPGMDGLQVLEAMKSDSGTCNIPVILVSALDELSGVSRAMERGAEDYLFKPFDATLFGARINAALERTRLRMRERERAQELERISEELQRSNEDLRSFAYAASHDLQSPLRTITTYLQLLERRLHGRLSPDESELFEFAVDGSKRMSLLISDLLTFSQVSTKERAIALVSCEEVLGGTLSDLQPTIEETRTLITHDPLPDVMADAVQLRQLFLNLISNAIKYRREEPPRIHVGASREENRWHLSVADNGQGIDPRYAREVFKLFRRLHGDEQPGTGLGLAICKRIMERLNGQIWVESTVGVGSTFHFTMPDDGAAARVA